MEEIKHLKIKPPYISFINLRTCMRTCLTHACIPFLRAQTWCGWRTRQPGWIGALGWIRLLGWSAWASFNYWKPRDPVIPTNIYIYIYIYIYIIYIYIYCIYILHLGAFNIENAPRPNLRARSTWFEPTVPPRPNRRFVLVPPARSRQNATIFEPDQQLHLVI
jgi:hypothetical protein